MSQWTTTFCAGCSPVQLWSVDFFLNFFSPLENIYDFPCQGEEKPMEEDVYPVVTFVTET